MHLLIPSSTGYSAGLVLCSVIAGLAYLLGATEIFGRLGIGPLTLAILVGVVVSGCGIAFALESAWLRRGF